MHSEILFGGGSLFKLKYGAAGAELTWLCAFFPSLSTLTWESFLTLRGTQCFYLNHIHTPTEIDDVLTEHVESNSISLDSYRNQ